MPALLCRSLSVCTSKPTSPRRRGDFPNGFQLQSSSNLVHHQQRGRGIGDDQPSGLSITRPGPGDVITSAGFGGPARHGFQQAVFSFGEIAKATASGSKVTCCDISPDGKLLATGGHDKKVVLWCAEALQPKSSLEENSMLITDVRFSPTMPRILATSSFDKTLRVWDADDAEYSLRTFTGHQASITSLDFHPAKQDVICSCDSDGQVRSWRANYADCLNRVRVSRSLELWDIRENESITLNNAHDGLVAALAASSKTGHIASVSLDKTVKLWK